ncbi:uncharacterized protein G2W53_001584 [Senna tora]|uniref:Uncharacterized protein n=1 Tax=Senna tora TaxID=362788 RepID=A0A835CJK3_9FABA|nr:uncharacterized protein G2W53_001584 [Senna tora]
MSLILTVTTSSSLGPLCFFARLDGDLDDDDVVVAANDERLLTTAFRSEFKILGFEFLDGDDDDEFRSNSMRLRIVEDLKALEEQELEELVSLMRKSLSVRGLLTIFCCIVVL